MHCRFAFFLLVFALFASAYTDESLSVTVRMNPDGTAHVSEKSVFNLDDEAEEAAFNHALGLGKTTLLDWQRFSDNIRYHLRGSVQKLEITAKREFNIRFTAASVTLEYDAGVVAPSTIEGRKTLYKLNSGLLVFSPSESSSEITLGNGVSLSIELPPGAYATVALPEPSESTKNSFTWQGPLSGAMDFEFVLEKSLSQEVNEFFVSTSNSLQSSYVWLLVAAFVILAGLKLLQISQD